MPAEDVSYAIFDPTGNVTALVTSEVAVLEQPRVAQAIMARHPKVEQVGFVRWALEEAQNAAQVDLRMAGGEFCGNATMCAAALYLLAGGSGREAHGQTSVLCRVSGAKLPVEVRLRAAGKDAFAAGIHMPAALNLDEVELSLDHLGDTLPLVRMEGISHLVVTSHSPFHALLDKRDLAERAVHDWCRELRADGLGLMFLDGGLDEESCRMTPLVYVPGSSTVFWEHSCASGSSAVGMYAARRQGAAIDLLLVEPGGTLRVTSDSQTGETWLFGTCVLQKWYRC